MRAAVATLFALGLGCHRESPSIRAEPAPIDVTPDAFDATPDASDVAADVTADVAPVPTRTATRTRFATHPLTMAAHGIDGTFELWRDSRLDDARVEKEWFGAAFTTRDPVPGFESTPPASAQVILRDAARKIVESRDLELPVAKLTVVQLGDDGVPYLEVAVDTYAGAGRWGGTTHKFVRVEAGRSRWLECAETYRCALGCNFHYDKRPSGGVDILEWRHWYTDTTLDHAVTNFRRIEATGGTCNTHARTAKGWIGADGSAPIHIPVDWPPRT